MANVFLIGLGAGAASALLFASIVSGNLLAILLFYLSALPVMLAAIAWSPMAGVFSILFGALFLGGVLNFWIALFYLFSIAIPAYALSYMAMLGREVAPASGGAAPQMEWYPVGRLVFWAALIAFGLMAFVVLQFGTTLEAYQKALRASLEQVLKAPNLPDRMKLPEGQKPEDFFNLAVAIMPVLAAMLLMATNLINLWFAGRIALVSGKLRRPWPNLNEVSLPLAAALFLAGAFALSFMSGLPGYVAVIAVSVFLLAFSIAGFSVLHAITRNLRNRTLVLAGAWISVPVLQFLPLLFVALLGIADSIFDLRGKVAARRPPHPPIQRT
jgi:hypothetical protein